MQYLGGKSKIARWLNAAIRPARRGRRFWDAFCGGLSMAVALSEDGPGFVSDANPALLSLYQAVATGWDPPSTLSEDDYKFARTLPDTDPRKAFAGFGCSFGGKWFGGYARARKEDDSRSVRGYASSARNVLLEDIGKLVQRGCQLHCESFFAVAPGDYDMILYLDPPYRNTTGYGGVAPFDHDKFYARVLEWAQHTDVFVSEYDMPFGRPVLEFTHDMSVAGGVHKNARVERLYHYGPSAPPVHVVEADAWPAELGACSEIAVDSACAWPESVVQVGT